MAKKQTEGYMSAKESRRISKENRKITNQFEKQRKRKNVPESEYLTTMHDPQNAVEFDNLHTYFFTDTGTVKSVDGVTFNVPIGKTVGVVGESGCGKSVTSLSLMQLIQRPQGQIVEGEIRLNLGHGKAYDVVKTPQQQMQHLRGNYVSMIFQEPMTSLNPVYTVGKQVREAILLHQNLSKEEAKNKVIDIFRKIGIPEPEKRYNSYPHQLSGGLRQRVMIGMAMVCEPELLIADEPTTALDVTIEAQILKLMKKLRDDNGTSILMITHNMGVVAQMCDMVYVMEQAETFELFRNTCHPYTEGLLKSIPRMDNQVDRLYSIRGVVPNLLHLPKGCSFCTRCDYATERCRQERPELYPVGEGHMVRCFRYEKGGDGHGE